MHSRSGRRRPFSLVACLALLTGLFTVVSLDDVAGAAAAAPLDGSRSSLAAPSCWAIKQQNPSSVSGIYWLQTPQLVAPQQFYCDQSTQGGGWVLIGRGREGWSWSSNGQGTAAAVRNTRTGSAAFAPAALPDNVVTALLGGQRVDALSDGIRVRRATDQAGTTYQEMRLKTVNRPAWSWAIGGGVRLSGVTVNGVPYTGYSTQSWGVDQGYLRLTTNVDAAHGNKMGWAYGNTVAGVNDSTSYLWQFADEKSALPFTQVFLRPTVTSPTYPAIPSTGEAASTLPKLMSSTTSNTTPWGVTGIKGAVSELNMEVETFSQVGNVMYVGGGFQNVQKGATPSVLEKVAQPWLAGFDVNTGAWLSSFRPKLNGMVWDLQAIPNGNLVAAGEFTSANGAPVGGLVELNPTTGATVNSFQASVSYVTTEPGIGPQVKAMDYHGGWLYIGGRFNRVSGGVPSVGPLTVWRSARLRVTDGRPDSTWRPNLNGSVIELDAASAGDRVYLSGYFTKVNGVDQQSLAVIDTAAGAASVPGLKPWQPSTGSGVKTYQQAIREAGSVVWMGGSQHILSNYARSDWTRLSSSIFKIGGDIQTIGVSGDVVYASCHCANYIYSGTYNYTGPTGTASDVHDMRYIGAFDRLTGALLTDFYPAALSTRSGIGGWELYFDKSGCMWFGGDFTRGSWLGSSYQWLGGFGKFCPRDSAAPTTPTALKATTATGGTQLSWGGSSDASGAVSYEVLRNDRVIATTTTTSYVDTTAQGSTTYWVRAVDTTGNRSHTSNAVTVG